MSPLAKARLGALAVVCMGAAASPAHAQSLAAEVDVTTGYSSEDNVKAVAAQMRLFGELGSGIRMNV
jgi:hypothetical protein